MIRCRCGPAGHISRRRTKSTTASSNPVSEFTCGHALLKSLVQREHPRPLLLGRAGCAHSAWLSTSTACVVARCCVPHLAEAISKEQRICDTDF